MFERREAVRDNVGGMETTSEPEKDGFRVENGALGE